MEYSELFAGRDFDLSGMRQRLQSVAGELGLPISPRTRTYNSRRAQELGKLAEKLGRMEAYQAAVYRAYFVEGINIALVEELLKIARAVGLPEEEARSVLEEGLHRREVDDDWRRARLLGITGVPAFVCGRKLAVGFRPYQDLEALIGDD